MAGHDCSLVDWYATDMDGEYLASALGDRVVAMATLAHPEFGRHDAAAWFFYKAGGVAELERFCGMAEAALGHRDFLLRVVRAAGHDPEVVRLLTRVSDPARVFEWEWDSEDYALVLRRRPEAAALLWRIALDEAEASREDLSPDDMRNGRAYWNEAAKAAYMRAVALCDFGHFDEDGAWLDELVERGSRAALWAVLSVLVSMESPSASGLLDAGTTMGARVDRLVEAQPPSRRTLVSEALGYAVRKRRSLEAFKSRRSPRYGPNDCPSPLDHSPSVGDHAFVVAWLDPSGNKRCEQFWFASQRDMLRFMCLGSAHYLRFDRLGEGPRLAEEAHRRLASLLEPCLALVDERPKADARGVRAIAGAWGPGQPRLVWTGPFRRLARGSLPFARLVRQRYFWYCRESAPPETVPERDEAHFAEWLMEFDGL